MFPKALKSCHKSNKSPNLVTLVSSLIDCLWQCAVKIDLDVAKYLMTLMAIEMMILEGRINILIQFFFYLKTFFCLFKASCLLLHCDSILVVTPLGLEPENRSYFLFLVTSCCGRETARCRPACCRLGWGP